MGDVACTYTQYDQRFFRRSTSETLFVNAPIWYKQDFTETGIIVDGTDVWTVAGVNGGTVAINAALNGTARVTTGGADDDDVDMATPLVFAASAGICCEARIAMNDVTGSAFSFGLTDATGEAADVIPCMYNIATLTATATDCAMFFYDPDATTDLVRAVAVNTGVDGTIFSASTVALVNAAYHIYRIETDANGTGNCSFYYDGQHAGTQALGIAPAAPLCVYVGFINRQIAANTLDIDYIAYWGGRG